jgi:hypothetical protein
MGTDRGSGKGEGDGNGHGWRRRCAEMDDRAERQAGDRRLEAGGTTPVAQPGSHGHADGMDGAAAGRLRSETQALLAAVDAPLTWSDEGQAVALREYGGGTAGPTGAVERRRGQHQERRSTEGP